VFLVGFGFELEVAYGSRQFVMDGQDEVRGGCDLGGKQAI